MRFFYDAEFIKKREARRLAAANPRKGRRDGSGEIDTADRMRLDEDGNEIGNAGSVDEVEQDNPNGEDDDDEANRIGGVKGGVVAV